jgi:hypothetical protein
MAEWRNPELWSYVVRDPTGDVYARGEAKSQQECLDRALGDAAAFAVEHFDADISLDEGWRFLLWPPDPAPNPT